MTEPTLLIVFLAALVTALATGLGAIPLLAAKSMSGRSLAIGNALAAGLMLAASVTLVMEGFNLSAIRTLGGIIAGVLLIGLVKKLLDRQGDVTLGQIQGADATKILMIMGVMTAHSAAEGVGVGVAFGGGRGLGDFITLAIALHNIPEGLAIALIMVPRGASVAKAGWWAIMSSLPQPLLAVPAFLFVLYFAPVLPVGLGLAAGAMLWMIFSELLPEALEETDSSAIGVIITLAFAAMMAATLVMG